MSFRTKKFKNKDYDFNYSIIDYKSTIGLEYSRMKKYKELEQYFKEIFRTKLNLSELYLFSWTKNKNSSDPVICTNINKTIFINFCKRFGIKQEEDKFKNFNNFSKNIIKEIEDISKGKLTINIKKNNIYMRYLDFSMKVNKNLYDKLKKRIKKIPERDKKIFIVLMRYYYIGFFSGNQGSVLPQYYKKIREKYNCNIELFASPMNVYYDNYFGLFYDVEKYFGCLGNVFNIVPRKGFFVANPPFYLVLMNDFFSLCLKHLNKDNNKLTFLITSPVWDIEKRKVLNKTCNDKLPTDYKTDLEILKLEKSKFNIYNNLWCKEDFPYFNYIDYKIVNYSATRIIVVSNDIDYINLNFLPKSIKI